MDKTMHCQESQNNPPVGWGGAKGMETSGQENSYASVIVEADDNRQ